MPFQEQKKSDDEKTITPSESAPSLQQSASVQGSVSEPAESHHSTPHLTASHRISIGSPPQMVSQASIPLKSVSQASHHSASQASLSLHSVSHHSDQDHSALVIENPLADLASPAASSVR